MKPVFTLLIFLAMVACSQSSDSGDGKTDNPFFNELNKAIQYGDVSHEDLTEYASLTLKQIDETLEGIRSVESPGFNNVFVAFDNVINDLMKASSTCFMFYWVSPDSVSRAKGLEGYQLLDSLSNSLTSDAGVFRQILAFSQTNDY
ncbi:MAG: hypothetical protein KAH12_00790, partial [Anaerolineales bacterium]|nr:hypothetical protein [Anaerolineales bacterium]